MNTIWECIIKLKKRNPRSSYKNPFLEAQFRCLVILDKNKQYVHLKTNETIIKRNLRNKVGNPFTFDDVVEYIPVKDLGISTATF